MCNVATKVRSLQEKDGEEDQARDTTTPHTIDSFLPSRHPHTGRPYLFHIFKNQMVLWSARSPPVTFIAT